MHTRCLREFTKVCEVDIWSLPNEILVHILKGSHIKNLLNVKPVHTHFCDLIENHAILWTTASFKDIWPSQKNLKYFEKAANHGNVEALIKLGIAYLYNEGLPGDFEGKKITENGARAAAMFCRVETLTGRNNAFTWLFIRPPWSLRGACCKEFVFDNMIEFAERESWANVHVCIARTLQLLDEDETHIENIQSHLRRARNQGSTEAAFLLWLNTYHEKVLDRAQELKSIRELRFIAGEEQTTVTLELCKKYADGKYGGIPRKQAAQIVREFIQASKPTLIDKMYRFQELTHSMRYILMDWLVEVANMKDYSSLTLHLAIHMVDRVLKVQSVSRARLQLLGVSAMVLCSRFLGKDIITIREAAWLTDNTYKYEDVVRMMGEITATLKGNFRGMTSFDYLEVLNLVAANSSVCRLLAQYVCELALLQSELGDYPQAKVAAACVLIARLSLQMEKPWPSQMELFAGYTVGDLNDVSKVLHKKCFSSLPMTDHRDVELCAVKHRYAELDFLSVSAISIIPLDDLCALFGAETTNGNGEGTRAVNNSAALNTSVHQLDNAQHMNTAFISSPCRHTSQQELDKSFELSAEREQAATPSIDKKLSDQFNEILNRSFSVCGQVDNDDGDGHCEVHCKNTGPSEQNAVTMHTAEPDDIDVEDLRCPDKYNFNSSCEVSPIGPRAVFQTTEMALSPNKSNNHLQESTDYSKCCSQIDPISDDVHIVPQNHSSPRQMPLIKEQVILADPNMDEMNAVCKIKVEDVAENEGCDVLEKVPMHNTPHCGSSQILSMPLVSNASPIGGMSYFKVDAPTSRYINTGVKIDFQNESNERSSNSLKILQNRASLIENSKRISVNDSSESNYHNFGGSQKIVPISSTPTGKKKTFSIFEDYKGTRDNVKGNQSSSSMTLRDLGSNVMPNNIEIRTNLRQPKKRRPSGSIGNQSKKQFL